MKLTNYESQLNPNTINGALQHTVTPASSGEIQFGNEALIKAMDTANATFQDIQRKSELVAVTNATTEYNQAVQDWMYDKDRGAMNRKGANAQTILPEYLSQEQKIRQQILSKYGFKLQDSVNAFNKMADSDATGTIGQIDKYMRSEFEQNALTAAQNRIDAATNSLMVLGKSGKVDNLTSTIKSTVAAYGVAIGWDEETVNSKTRDQLDASANTVLKSILDSGDFTRVTDLSHSFAMAGVSEKVVAPYRQAAQEKEIASIISNSSDYDKMLSEDTYKHMTLDEFKNEARYQAVLKAKAKLGARGALTKEGFMAAIEGQESGGNENAVNADTGAYGLFQIMPENWEPWAAEAGIPGADRSVAENQRKVAAFKMGQYIDQYGVDGAIVAWYGGEGTAEAYLNNPSSPVWDEPQVSNGNTYPSIRQYLNDVKEKMTEGVAPRELTEGELEDIYKIADTQATAAWNKRESYWKEEATQALMQIQERRRQMELDGASLGDINSMLQSAYAGSTNKYFRSGMQDELNSAAHAIANERRRQETAKTKATELTMQNIKTAMIGGASLTDAFKMAEDSGIVFTDKQLADLNEWGNQQRQGTGAFSGNYADAIGIAKTRLNLSSEDYALLKNGAQEALASWAANYKQEHNGMNPSIDELADEAVDIMSNHAMVTEYSKWGSWLNTEATYNPARLRAHGYLDAFPVGDNYVRVIYINENGQQDYTDIYRDDFEEKMRG